MRVELGRRSGWAFNGRVLIERDREVEKLLQLLADAVDGEGRLVFLGGEAGVGKTSLMSAVAAAAPSGVEVRWGAADTLTAAAALGAVVDALPELQEMVGDPTGVDRLELFRRVRSMLASGSTLLVLEDLHWADEATLDLLRFLGRRLSGLRALLVVTYRPEDVPPHHVFSVMLEILRVSAVSTGSIWRHCRSAAYANSSRAHRSGAMRNSCTERPEVTRSI